MTQTKKKAIKKDYLNFGKYLKEGEIIITPDDAINPLWALVVDKSDFKPNTDFSNITEDDLVVTRSENAEILLYDGRRFGTNLSDVSYYQKTYGQIITDFSDLGYTTIGDSYKMYITADGKVRGYNEGRAVAGNPHYRWQDIPQEVIESGKLLSEFLTANYNNELDEFLKDSSILTQENLKHINKEEFQKIFMNAVKLEWQRSTYETCEEMVSKKAPKEEIKEEIKEMKAACKQEIKSITEFFKDANKRITIEEEQKKVSDLDKALEEINSL